MGAGAGWGSDFLSLEALLALLALLRRRASSLVRAFRWCLDSGGEVKGVGTAVSIRPHWTALGSFHCFETPASQQRPSVPAGRIGPTPLYSVARIRPLPRHQWPGVQANCRPLRLPSSPSMQAPASGRHPGLPLACPAPTRLGSNPLEPRRGARRGGRGEGPRGAWPAQPSAGPPGRTRPPGPRGWRNPLTRA